ncbi:MAG TPA: heat-inducible transcriptional repressor HrcA [Candidatus Limnocylindrales bacterium]
MARRPRRSSGPLDFRAQAILRAVIEEYVTSAAPVSSQALVERYGLGVSSATVRNVLAELEAFGYLTHPHTSAGRVPTDAGYRLYVESIAEGESPPPVEQRMIRHQFGQVEYASEHWFRLAASTLAGLTRSAGLATPAKPEAARIRRVDLVAINERLASLILVLREGTIKQLMVNLPAPTDQADLAAIAARLDDLAAGLTADELGTRLGRLAEDAASGGADEPRTMDLILLVGGRIVRTLREFDAAVIEDVFSDGLLNVMEAPEFAQSDKLRRVFAALENRAYLGRLVEAVARAGVTQVFIGHENLPAEMTEVSLVLAPYGQPGRAVGVVGVLGPTRMAYPHAIGTVRFVSGLMNELVEHLYA